MSDSPNPTPSSDLVEQGLSSRSSAAARRGIAARAVGATVAVYLGYGVTGWLPIPAELRYFGLVAAFLFLPSWMLRADPDRQERYQVGPGSVLPPWRWVQARWGLWLAVLVFPPFVLAFFWFYARVCQGDLSSLTPVLSVEALTPWSGGLENYLQRLCRGHQGGFWPGGLHLPSDWLAYGGLGIAQAVVVELFVIALPEEVFHRGYLMSALEEVWPPRHRVLGAPLGLAAVVSSLLFAVGHLVGMSEVARLATFFPSLLFSWLWRKSNSLWAPALFHTASNLLMAVLIASTFAR